MRAAPRPWSRETPTPPRFDPSNCPGRHPRPGYGCDWCCAPRPEEPIRLQIVEPPPPRRLPRTQLQRNILARGGP